MFFKSVPEHPKKGLSQRFKNLIPFQINPATMGYLLAAVASVLFSIKGIIVKLAYGATPQGDFQNMAIMLLFLRMTFAMPIYVLIGALELRRHKKQGKTLAGRKDFLIAALIGVLGYYFSSYLDFAGLLYLTAQFERMLIYTSYPFFVIVLSALFFGGRITLWMIGALFIASSGILIIFFEGATAKGDYVSLGVSLVLASAFCFALYQLFAKSAIAKIGSRLFTCTAMLGAWAGTSLHFLLSQNATNLTNIPSTVMWLALAIAIFCTLLPSFLLNHSLETVGAQAVALIGTLSPVSTICIATLVLGEPFTMTDGIGTALVVGGILLFTWYDSKSKKDEKKISKDHQTET